MRYYVILLIAFILNGCGEKEQERSKDESEPTVVVKILTPSKVNEPLKAVAILLNSEFEEKNSQIFVVLQKDGNEHLKKDLSNEYEIEIEGFANLEIDSLNQKWIGSKSKRYSAVFGRTFKKSGKDTIRGYVWDFYGFDLTDSIIPSQSRKYYFEFGVNTTSE